MTDDRRDDADSGAMRRTTQPEPFLPHLTRAEAQRVLHVWQPSWASLKRLTTQATIGHQPLRVALVSDTLATMHQRRWPRSPAGVASAIQAVRLFGPPQWRPAPSWVIRVDHPNVEGWVTVQAWTGWAALALLQASMPECLDAEAHPDPATPSGRAMAKALELYP